MSTEEDAISFYGREIVALARTMSLPQMRLFLRGALAVAGTCEAIEPVREAYIRIVDGDERLEQIESGQLRLALDPEPETEPEAQAVS